MADPHLEIRGRGGGGSSRPLDKRGGGGLQKIFSPLRASVWSKNKGGGPPGPSPGSDTGYVYSPNYLGATSGCTCTCNKVKKIKRRERKELNILSYRVQLIIEMSNEVQANFL